MIAELGLEMSVDILATELEDLLKSRSTTAQKSQEAEEVRKNDKVDDQERNTQSTPPAASPPPSVIAIADIERSEHATSTTATTIQDTKDATLAHIDDKPPAPAVPSPCDPEQQIPSPPSATGADHRALDETATWMPDSSAVQDLPYSLSVASMSMPIDTPLLLLLLPAVEKPLSPGKIVTALSSVDCSEDVVQVGAAVVAVLPCEDEEVTPVTAVSIPESDSASPLLMEASTAKDALFPRDEHDKFSFRPPPVGETNTLLLADEPQPLAPVVDCPSESSPPPPPHHHHQQQFNILEDSKGSAKEGSDSDDASSNASDSYFPFPSFVSNNADTADIEETLQKELEKIDQESRVARRAFENRITKHITIQV